MHNLGSAYICLPKHNDSAALTTQLEESMTFDPRGQLINTNTLQQDADWPAYDTLFWMIEKKT